MFRNGTQGTLTHPQTETILLAMSKKKADLIAPATVVYEIEKARLDSSNA